MHGKGGKKGEGKRMEEGVGIKMGVLGHQSRKWGREESGKAERKVEEIGRGEQEEQEKSKKTDKA